MCEEHKRLEQELAALQRTRQKDTFVLEEALGAALEAGQRAKAAERELATAKEQSELVEDLRRVLGRLLPSNGGLGTGAALDEDSIVAKILARMPTGGAGAVYQVTAPEKLRKDFQREESERIVDSVRNLRALAKQVLRLLVAIDQRLFQKVIAERLGRSTQGGSVVDLGKAVKELAELGLVDVDPKNGVCAHVREKIAQDLAAYQASDGDVEAVYQSVLFEVANEGTAAA